MLSVMLLWVQMSGGSHQWCKVILKLSFYLHLTCSISVYFIWFKTVTQWWLQSCQKLLGLGNDDVYLEEVASI